MELNRHFDVPLRTFRFTRRVDDRLTRFGVTGTFARDCVLAACCVAVSLAILTALLVVVPELENIRFGAVAIAVLVTVTITQSVLLCLRRVRPELCLILVAACQVLFLASIPANGSFRGPATFIAAYTIGALLSVRSIVVMALVAVCVETVGGTMVILARPGLAELTGNPAEPGAMPTPLTPIVVNFLAGALVYGVMPLIGLHVATRRRHVRLVRIHAAEAIKAQQAQAAAAVATERSRLARELHDIAAHHLSGMVVQAAAAERLIDRDRTAAREATAWIRSQGKETLRNLRLVVGVLRERSGIPGDHDGQIGENSAPVPSLAVLDTLVRTARQLGNPVTVERRGQPRDLPPIADVTLYRVAQEALSNARQYAPETAVRLTLRFATAQVTLHIENDPPSRVEPPDSEPRQGLGLIGMTERVQLVGGTLSCGPTPAGGWRVTATVPDMVPTPESGGSQ